MRTLLIVTGSIALIVSVAAVRTHRSNEMRLIFDDIASGRATVGPLHADRGQTLCLDSMDAYRARRTGDDVKTLAIDDQLFAQGRCTESPEDARYDMTAEGRERFTTPHGSVDLWPAN